MCVIMATKLKLNNSDKENWFLFKIRDKAYDPKYSLKIYNKNGVETISLEDQSTRWTEGVNSSGIMVVNAALDNHADISESGDQTVTDDQLKSAEVLVGAMCSKTVDMAVKILTEGLFIGTTFVSDGDKLVIVEIYVKKDSFDRELKKQDIKKLEKMSAAEQGELIRRFLKKDDYDVATHTVKKDWIAVRTNHGKLLPDAGYQENDEDSSGWSSSMHRWKYAKQYVEKLGQNAHPFAVLTTLKNLIGVDKNPQNCPIRDKEKATKEKPYYSTTVVMLTPTGTFFAIPLNAEIDKKSQLALKKERKVDFVMLPKNLPLFEGIYKKHFTKINYKKYL